MANPWSRLGFALLLFGWASAPASSETTSGSTPEFPETRELIALVEAAGEEVARSGVEAACSAFHEEGSSWLAADTYVFVLDFEGKALCHPARPSLEGSSLLELRDPAGTAIVRGFLRELEHDDDGWFHYHWPRPGERTFYWKSTYVRRAKTPEGAEVMVGSGLYQMPMEPFFVVDQVDDAAALIAREGEAAFEVLRDRTSGFRFLDAYVFVLDWEGNQLVNAGFPELEGTNTIDLEDLDGKNIGRAMMALLEQQPSGWVDYLWPRPGDRRPARKSAYVRRVDRDGKRYLVGAGIYR